MLDKFGKYSTQVAVHKLNAKCQWDIFRNNVTRRQSNIIESTHCSIQQSQLVTLPPPSNPPTSNL